MGIKNILKKKMLITITTIYTMYYMTWYDMKGKQQKDSFNNYCYNIVMEEDVSMHILSYLIGYYNHLAI